MDKRIDYLDLFITQKQKSIIQSENYRFACSFPSDYKHTIHTQDKTLDICNTIVDLQINLGIALERTADKQNRIFQDILETLKQKNIELREIKDLFKNNLKHQAEPSFIKELEEARKEIISLKRILKEKQDKTDFEIDKLTDQLAKTLKIESRPRQQTNTSTLPKKFFQYNPNNL